MLDPAARQRWMRILARASTAEIEQHLQGLPRLPSHTAVRGPELGSVMVQGRTGGGGAPFNLGEMTVARCTIRTEAGGIGHAYVRGQDLRQAELAAVLDAAMQDPAQRDAIEASVITPLAAAQEARRAAVAAEAAATRVQFFTLAPTRA